jgi:MFS family permease
LLHHDFKQSDRTMKVLLLGVLLSHLAFYMVLPILPIFLKINEDLVITQIGVILAVSSFSFQGGSIMGGYLADRLGRRSIIVLGAFLRAVGLMGFGFSTSYWMFLVSAFISGVGGGFNAPSTKAAIAALASQSNNETTAFSLRSIAANIGTGAAGLLVYFILGGSSELIFYVAAAVFAVLGIVSWLWLPKNCGEQPCPIIPADSFLEILKNKAFLVFSLVSILIWALYTQLSLAIPIRASVILPDPSIVSLIWTINSVTVIFLQAPISRWLLHRIHPMNALALGILFIGAGLSSIYWTTDFTFLALSGVIFVIGEMLILPTMDTTVSRLASAQMIGVFFGLANFISGLGEGMGNYAGGLLLSKAQPLCFPR